MCIGKLILLIQDATSQTLAMRASQMDLVSQLERQQGRRHALQHLLGESERKLVGCFCRVDGV